MSTDEDQQGTVDCQSNLTSHGGVTSIGPLPLSSGREFLKVHRVCSGPVILSIYPLTDYQQQLIDAILLLRSQQWNDPQIAKHFNEIGWLTPRGHRFLGKHVFAIRTKYQKRLERLGEK